MLVFHFHCVISKIYCMNAALIFLMRQSGSGRTVSAQCLRQTFVENRFSNCAPTRTGNGIWTKYSWRSMAKHTTSGVPSITKEKSWKLSSPKSATSAQHWIYWGNWCEDTAIWVPSLMTNSSLTALQYVNLVLMDMKTKAVGSTTEQRTHTYHFDDESEPCCALGECEVYRNSHPFIHRFKTISKRNATNIVEKISRKAELPPSTNNVNFLRHKTCPAQQFWYEFEFVWQHRWAGWRMISGLVLK